MNAVLKPSLYEQLLALPEHVAGEILDGALYAQPRPAGRHGLAAGALNADLAAPFGFGRGGPGGWWIIPEPEVHFVRDVEVAVPDLAGWRRERMPSVPEGHRFEIVPDWACEILSPATTKKDRVGRTTVLSLPDRAHCTCLAASRPRMRNKCKPPSPGSIGEIEPIGKSRAPSGKTSAG
jgi:hypothetical protein